MATIAKTKSGKYKAVIRDPKGRHLKSKTFTRKTDARIWARRIEADREKMAALDSAGATITVRKLAEERLAEWRGKDKSYPAQLAFWVAEIGDMRLVDVSANIIQEKLDQYAAGNAMRGDGKAFAEDAEGRLTLVSRTARTARKRKPATVNRRLAALSGLLKFAIVRKRYMTVNPARDVASLTENNKIVRYLSDAERKALLKACKASEWQRLHLLVLMALMTGARQSELLRLRWSDIDFEKRSALAMNTKNSDDRVMPLPRPVIEALRPFREVGSGLVFPSERKPGQAFEFRKNWNKALLDAGIEKFRFHDLRHSCASYLAMAGTSLLEISEVLGHRSLETTKRYAHIDQNRKQELTDTVLGGLEL